MLVEFHNVEGFVPTCKDNPTKLQRTHGLIRAAERLRGFTIFDILVRPSDDEDKSECVVIEVESDGVPKRNPPGIRYRERLSLIIPENPQKLVEAIPLRKGFPIMIHQNSRYGVPPISLCLYNDSAVSVARTWTPESFLSRIRWWLEGAAKGDLHEADRPPEDLFFDSGLELILPWNFSEEFRIAPGRFIVRRSVKRAGYDRTYFVEQLPPDIHKVGLTLFNLDLPPVTHGFRHSQPYNLGALASIFSDHGLNLRDALISAIEARTPTVGVIADGEDCTIFLVRIPIRRTDDAAPEMSTFRAYFSGKNWHLIGEKLGVLSAHNGRYFRTPLIGVEQQVTAWEEISILPMDIREENDAEDYRSQSGNTDVGPNAVLIGAGALGSSLLELWTRSGWGNWTVIDNDYLQPHNMTRHAGYAAHLGYPKAVVATDLVKKITNGALSATPIDADACDVGNPTVSDALHSNEFALDVSTTLDYPRLISTKDDLCRHASAFITPTGNGAVLLIEDATRQIRLATLEAQYYRAIIEEPWGTDHLSSKGGTFWSGASCRDISAVLPYSHIMSGASLLAEQIPMALKRTEAGLVVWSRNAEDGTISRHVVPIYPDFAIEIEGVTVHFDEALREKLKILREQGLPNETGGVLLGYYDFNIKSVFIVAALPAPPDSIASPTGFSRGTAGLEATVNEAAVRTGGMIGYIGEWHSHPEGHTVKASGHDVIQLAYLAKEMAEAGLPAFQLIVGQKGFNCLRMTLAE